MIWLCNSITIGIKADKLKSVDKGRLIVLLELKDELESTIFNFNYLSLIRGCHRSEETLAKTKEMQVGIHVLSRYLYFEIVWLPDPLYDKKSYEKLWESSGDFVRERFILLPYAGQEKTKKKAVFNNLSFRTWSIFYGAKMCVRWMP